MSFDSFASALGLGAWFRRTAKVVPEWDRPFRTSLFPVPGNTWQFFSQGYDDAKRQAIVDWLHGINANAMIFLCSNQDGPVNLYVGNRWGGEFDEGKCASFKAWCETLVYEEGLCLFPCFFCDEDNQPLRKMGATQHDLFYAKICELIDHLDPYYIVGLESSEYWSVAQVNDARARIKAHTGRPVGTHMQWKGGALPTLDFMAYEHDWHPGKGDEYSAQRVAEITAGIIRRAGIPVFASEYNTNVTGSRYAEQAAAQLLVEGVMGVG